MKSTVYNPVFKASFDAWGRLRDPATLQPYAHDTQPALFLRRGYTGHEHLPVFGLINMNARLYDPVIGRFLSPDPYVQTPDFSQSFNRYSYAWNNPLIYIDENGEFILTALAAGNAHGHYLRLFMQISLRISVTAFRKRYRPLPLRSTSVPLAAIRQR